jgi:hypothetical protein
MKETLERIIKDSSQIKDFLVPVKKLTVDSGIHNEVAEQIPAIFFETSNNNTLDSQYLTIHDNAIVQVGQKLNIPTQYLQRLKSGNDWEKVLFKNTLSDHFSFSQRNNEKVLIRSNNGVLKAFLSDKYDRYNSVNVLSTFAEGMAINGFKINEAYYNGISYFIEYADKDHPIMLNNQAHWLGVQYRNSDFGQSALDIKLMLIKQVCSNGMTMSKIMRSVHKGRQLGFDDNNSFELSKETLDLEAKLKVSIVKDIIPQIVSEEARINLVEKYMKVDKIEIPVEKVIKQLPNTVTKSDIESINKVLLENTIESGVRDCGNIIRVANAISFLANDFNNEQAITKARYKDIAGNLIEKFVIN